MLALEEVATGEVIGTSQIFSRVGVRWPFYSYRLATLTQTSQQLRRTFRAEMLNLVTDFEGATEVGGLFLPPEKRREGVGRLLARSRYRFIAMTRRPLGEEVLAEMRGLLD